VRIWILVGVGGALGSMARYGLTVFVSRYMAPSFPYGTFVVNIVGCLVFGLIVALAGDRVAIGTPGRAFLLIGILGGFTTFSSFTNETFILLRNGEGLAASLNIVGQVVIGLAALWAGYLLPNLL
jgi:CrcB protein